MDSPPRFRSERALLLATLAGALSRGPSILPRTRQDETLIVTGAGLMGAAAGVVTEALTCALARVVPGRRLGATVVLSGLGLGALAWAAR